MVVAKFEQKQRLSRRKYILYEDRIGLEMKGSETTSRYEVDLVDLGDKLHYHSENTTGGFIIFGCLLLIPAGMTFLWLTRNSFNSGQIAAAWLCGVVLIFLAYIKEHVDDLFLTGGTKNIYFFRNTPSEQKVLEFIELIKSTKKTFIKKEHLAFDEGTDEDEYYHRLKWLKDQKLLDDEEYENAKIDFEIKRLLS
ncbi:MAG: hypothetical protein LH615_11340 [Ferruginibacter sp.]|nr:hypothetical protein [Ferruginibacter sp.]